MREALGTLPIGRRRYGRSHRGVRIGSRFLFVDRSQVDADLLEHLVRWHPDLEDNSREQRTIPLPADTDFVLGNLQFGDASDPSLSLSCVTTDRDLYRYLTDVVHVLVVDLDRPGQTTTVLLRSRGAEIERQTVELDDHGLGMVRFRELPIGEYVVELAEESRWESPCSFRVAGFQLAPLVATLSQQQLSGRTLSVKLQLVRFGKPFTGAARIDLLDGGERIDCRLTQACGGLALVSLELSGDGPHTLEIHLRDDANATATIPLAGSRREERSATSLSRCGPIYSASMMPVTGSHAVRGLYVSSTGQQDAPLWLHGIDQRKITLEVKKRVEDCCVVVRSFAPGGKCEAARQATHQVHRLGDLAAGDVVEIEAPSPAGLISLGGFVDGCSWEAKAVTISPGQFFTQIELVPSAADGSEVTSPATKVAAGSSITIRVRAEGASDGSVALVVKDARLASSSRPVQELASRIKQAAQQSAAGPVLVSEFCLPVDDWYARSTYDLRGPAISEDVLRQLGERGVLTSEQVAEIRAEQTSPEQIAQTIVKRGYTDSVRLCRAVGEIGGWEYVDLAESEISPDVVELCPESVARENRCFPISEIDDVLTFAMANPFDLETIDKLRFILNRQVRCAIGTSEQILEAINHYYGQAEYYSADTMLQEFTDTAIDFTDTANVDALADVVPERRHEVPPPALREESHVLFCDVVPLCEGVAEIELRLPDEPCHYTIETFAASQLDWDQRTLHFEAAADPYLKLLVPEVLFREDSAIGRLVARTSSPSMSVRLLHNGQNVLLRDANHANALVDGEELNSSETELAFEVLPGTYQAELVDHSSGRRVVVTKEVAMLGELTERRRIAHLLMPGESVETSETVSRIRIMPNPKRIRFQVAHATSNYEHLCCEQTAAKLFAALVCVSLAEPGSPASKTAIEAVQAGIRRMRTLWSPRQGFASYPQGRVYPDWGLMATHHLWKTRLLKDRLSDIPEVAMLLHEIDDLVNQAVPFYGINDPPTVLRSSWDAYVTLRHPECRQAEAALELARKTLRRPQPRQRVYGRQDQAYAAACLLREGTEADVVAAISVANKIFEAIEASGMLYSTLDSVALLILMQELSRRRLYDCDSSITVNGQTQTVADVLSSGEPIESLVAGTSQVSLELLTWSHTDWTHPNRSVPLKVSLEHLGHHGHRFREGESITLRVTLPHGYEVGDLLWIALPPSLSRLEGGGQVKQFTLDLQGEPTATIRLAATDLSSPAWQAGRPQHFLVCLRNMYDEDRIGNLGPIPVHVEPRPVKAVTAN
ncbi:general secretion pathway protein GspE [Blastopirellula marina]|uniref:General secretion pathway protein GspE n=1 Tax=Blastopirellula marina TaxID=124 RepID=A0A2S8F7J8_9BACT|nr:general secretion pathway protein GspE [Blastopirellula marina]PQO27904.1 general secretion pathway protein GspE [Blastopirellula marina]PTL41640.1 general secretion pathway protein GspE [Blastopirellula marina]